MKDSTVQIVGYTKELLPYFKALNIAWISKYFVVEPIDEHILSEPETHILAKGGYIYFVTVNNTVAGTYALLKVDDSVYELGKMAVDEAFQGQGIGKALVASAIEKSKEAGAKKLILFSNTILKPAIHLYTKAGFKEVANENAAYKRSNIKMEIDL